MLPFPLINSTLQVNKTYVSNVNSGEPVEITIPNGTKNGDVLNFIIKYDLNHFINLNLNQNLLYDNTGNIYIYFASFMRGYYSFVWYDGEWYVKVYAHPAQTAG